VVLSTSKFGERHKMETPLSSSKRSRPDPPSDQQDQLRSKLEILQKSVIDQQLTFELSKKDTDEKLLRME
jgi:hypothetical protein